MTTAVPRVWRDLAKVSAWLEARSLASLTLLIVGFQLVRAGIGLPTIDINLESWLAVVTSNFPLPTNYGSASASGYQLAIWLLRPTNLATFLAFALVLTTGALFLTGLQTKRSRNISVVPWSWKLLIVGLSPAYASLFYHFGRYDIFTFLGTVMIALNFQSVRWVLLGAFVMSSGNPEQALVISLAYCLLSLGPSFRKARKPALFALLTSGVIFVFVTTLSRMEDGGSRASRFQDLLKPSLWDFMKMFPIQAYAGLGIFLIFILFSIYQSDRWDRFAIIGACLLVPFALTATTLDQTRVLATVAVGPCIVVSLKLLKEFVQANPNLKQYVAGSLVLCGLLFIPINIFASSVLSPYEWPMRTIATVLQPHGICLFPNGC